jgi:hypothetical protein
MKKKNIWYEILDIDKFIESTRVLVFDSFGKNFDKNTQNFNIFLSDLKPEEVKELDSILTQEECLIIAKDFVKKTNKANQINEKDYMAMIECFNSRMVSNMLKNLVASGVLESAYDSEANDFIFWVNDEKSKEIQKPETN